MVSSMLSVCALAGLLTTAGMGSAPATPAPRHASAWPTVSWSVSGCSTEPTTVAIIAEIPWPQQRYDLASLSQITDGAGVRVAVVDSGVNASHPQLAAAVDAGADMLDRTGDGREDCVGHGTAVASIIAARPASGAGLRGLAPAARIVPVRVSERVPDDAAVDGAGSVADLAAGIRAATASRPRPAVINLSISTPRDDGALRAAVTSALDADIVVVAAVGNRHDEGDPTPFPASYSGVVGVGAIDRAGLRVPSSQTGTYVDIVAPGDGVVAAAGRRGHAVHQGTSFAAAFVAGTAALIRARWPHMSRTEVVRRLLATADPAAGSRGEYGVGVVNPMRALTEVLTEVLTPAVLPPPGSPPAAPASPVAPIAPRPFAGAARAEPAWVAIGAAVVLVLLAAAVPTLAAAIRAGRRRGWRPDAAMHRRDPATRRPDAGRHGNTTRHRPAPGRHGNTTRRRPDAGRLGATPASTSRTRPGRL